MLKTWTRWLLGLGIVSAALLVMVETDSLLRLLEVENGTKYGMDTFQAIRFSAEEEGPAIAYWLANTDVSRGVVPATWVTAYVLADMVFALGYGYLLYLALRRFFREPGWFRWLGFAPAIADIVEDFVILGRIRGGWDLLVLPFSWLKWGLLASALAPLLLPLWTALKDEWSDNDDKWPKVVWRFRVQVSILLILAIAIAVPSRDRLGELEQLPDVLRGAHCEGECAATVLWLIRSSGLLLILAAFVWISGRWLPFGPAKPAESAVRARLRNLLWVAVAVTGGGYLLLGLGVWIGFPFAVELPDGLGRFSLAAPLGAAALLLLVVLGLHLRFGKGRPPADYPEWTWRHAALLNALATAVIMTLGLGLARAFTGPMLLNTAGNAELYWFLTGVAIVAAGPGIFWLLGRFNRREWDEPATICRFPWYVTAIALLTGAVLLFDAGRRPAAFGESFGANGAVAVALTLICLIAGGLVAIAGWSTPLLSWSDNRRRLALPVVVLVIATFAVLGSFDKAGTYHDVNFRHPTATITIEPIEDSFKSWIASATACRPDPTTSPAAQRLQPMLFIAAAGGGIRASYWTELVLNSLSAQTCGNTNIFVVSSASGASVGTALWSDPQRDLQDKLALGSASLADRRALGGVGAAWFLRDLPRAFVGFDPGWDDRAEIMEESWILRQERALGRPFPDAPAGPGQAWRPITILNSTDLLTGCRIAVTRIAPPGSVRDHDGTLQAPPSPGHCDNPNVADATLPGSFYISQFTETASCDRAGAPSAATAAMLSARFPFVTPSGSLYACLNNEPLRIQAGDGGYLENSGMLSAMQVWRQVQPMVAEHNRLAAATDDQRIIVPFFLAIGNSYRSVVPIPPRPRVTELLAPSGARHAAEAISAPARLEVETRGVFSGVLPGTETTVGLGCDHGDRFAAAAPISRPEVTAPLGWTLSRYTTLTLGNQWRELEPKLGCVFNLLNRNLPQAPTLFTPSG